MLARVVWNSGLLGLAFLASYVCLYVLLPYRVVSAYGDFIGLLAFAGWVWAMVSLPLSPRDAGDLCSDVLGGRVVKVFFNPALASGKARFRPYRFIVSPLRAEVVVSLDGGEIKVPVELGGGNYVVVLDHCVSGGDRTVRVVEADAYVGVVRYLISKGLKVLHESKIPWDSGIKASLRVKH